MFRNERTCKKYQKYITKHKQQKTFKYKTVSFHITPKTNYRVYTYICAYVGTHLWVDTASIKGKLHICLYLT